MATKTIAVITICLVATASIIAYFTLKEKQYTQNTPETGPAPQQQSGPSPAGSNAPETAGDIKWLLSLKQARITAQDKNIPIIARLTPVCFPKCPSCEATNKLLATEKIQSELKNFVLVHFDLNNPSMDYDIPPSIPKVHCLTFYLPDGTFLKTIAGVPVEANLLTAFKKSKEYLLEPPLSFLPQSDNGKKLLAMLKKVEDMRNARVVLLDLMKDIEANPETVRILHDGLWTLNPTRRAICAEILSSIHYPVSFEEFVLALQDPEDSVIPHAIYGLGRIGDTQAEDMLIEKLKGTPDIQYQSAVALGYLKSKKAINALCKLAGTTKNASVKDAVLRALESVLDPACAPEVRKALKDEVPEIRAEAARLLGLLKDEAALPDLRRMLLNENELFSPRHMVTHALANIGGKESETILLESIETSDQLIAGCIAEALGWLKAADSAEKIIPVLYFDNSPARGLAAIGLGDIGDVKYRDLLEKMVKNDTGKFAFFGAQLGLCLMEPERDRGFLFDALKLKPDPDDQEGRSVRAYAARYMGRIYAGNAAEIPLITSLLINAIDPSDWYFNREILTAVKSLTGKDLAAPPDDAPDAWEEIKNKLRE